MLEFILYSFRENLPRREGKRKTQRVQVQAKSRLKKQENPTPRQDPLLLRTLTLLPIVLSPLAMSKWSNLHLATSLQEPKTLLRVATLESYSVLPQRRALCSKYLRTWGLFLKCTNTLRLSRSSLWIKPSERRNVKYSSLLSNRLATSTQLPSNSLKSWLKTGDSSSWERSPITTPNCTKHSTKRRKSQWSPQRHWAPASNRKSLRPWKKTLRTKAKSSSWSTRSMNPSWAAFRCTPRVSSWTWVSVLVLTRSQTKCTESQLAFEWWVNI